ncbi:MAG TPA: pitrilysin family protein [Longimicrobiaceae bacterium]|nr:pitrilysin family protein [Longimicrobiaceae bacterium]
MRIPIDQYRLDNGLRVILSEDHRQPVVGVNLWYNVGSRNERPGRTGFAHLFEHMMFQGSENVPDTEHIAHVERVGGSMNGSTWLDRTNYFETMPASRLELALWLESDRMGFLLPAMTQEKLDNQRSVVQNERRWRVDNQPYGDWDERIQALLYPPDHPYHHSVIGSMEDLDAATLEDVSAFFRTYYAPNNAVLTICGDFDPVAARSLVERYFGSIPRGPDVPPVPGRTELPPRLGQEVREVIESDAALARVYLAFRMPAYGRQGFFPGDVAAHVLASGKSSRLYRSLVREQRLAQSVVAFAFPIVTGAAMLVLWATANPGVDAERLERAIWDEIEVLGAGASPEEVERAVNGIESRQTVALQQVGERADQLSMFATLFDDPERINTELDEYRAVTAEGVSRFAVEYLRRDNVVSLIYLPRARSEAA